MKNRRRELLGGRSRRPVVEGLEVRRMLSASIDHHGRLIVSGTGHADDIFVALDIKDPSKLEVSVNGKTSVFAAAVVRSLKIDAHGGADSVTIDPAIAIPANVMGEGKTDKPDPPKKPPGDNTRHNVSGTIVLVDADTNQITIAVANGPGPATQTTFSVTSATMITADGHAVALGSLNVATPVTIQTSGSNPTIAAGIVAVNRHVMGMVTSVDASNRILTIRKAGGTVAIFSVNANATITINRGPSPLSAVAPNMNVDLTISAFNNSDVIAITGHVAKPHGKPKKPKD